MSHLHIKSQFCQFTQRRRPVIDAPIVGPEHDLIAGRLRCPVAEPAALRRRHRFGLGIQARYGLPTPFPALAPYIAVYQQV